MICADTPFVLLDDARVVGASAARLYRSPGEQLVAHSLAEIPELLAAARRAQRSGKYVAGYLAYEAGLALEKGLTLTHGGSEGDSEGGSDRDGGPLAWFGVFDGFTEVDCDAVPSLLPDPAGAWLSPIRPGIEQRAYASAFAAVQNYISAGDIYQANLTFRAYANYAGNPLALYAAVRPQAAAGYGGIIWTGADWHLSFSPELFFALKDGKITTKPMKGTAVRLADPVADHAAAMALRDDPKQRAENLMIVDLLRNDLSRVCASGSVKVPELYSIESYPTVHQMTSTVTGQLADGKDAIDLIAAIFPCGSITGAPKIRAMQIIDELEQGDRNIYCGSIGRIDADGSAAFNVAIRTFSLNESAQQVSLGLGSGIVADSRMGDEWSECLAKGEFARMTGKRAIGYGFDLIETMRFEPAAGLLRLEFHLERMKASAQTLGFEFDRHAVRNQLHAATFHLQRDSKVRLLCSVGGAIAIEVRDAPAASAAPWNVSIVPLPVAAADFRLAHKTSDRGFYDSARLCVPGINEVIFADPAGYLTEGSFTSVFAERSGKLLTPPLPRGCLPSVLRRELIEQGRAIEADIRGEDLAGGFFLGNSLRGLIPAVLLTKAVAKS